MNEESGAPSESSLTAAERRYLDDACDTFESTWRNQHWPLLEGYLDGCTEPLRSILLSELIKIDVHWRAKAADTEQLRTSLLERFAAEQKVVQGVLGSTPGRIISNGMSLDEIGPFKSLEKIGEGGFGIVFRAMDTRHQRSVALKIPRFGHQLVGQELARFLREARAAGSLDHPNIARVWDSGTIAGVTYIAYQLVEGENLNTRLKEISQRSPMEIVDIMRKLAWATQYAHDCGLIHRDIKPSNVLLTTDNQPILTDFGLALATTGEATRSLAGRIGTLDYMSPEQAIGAQEEVGERTDLWSLGVVLYELLSGVLPFQGATDIQLCSIICNAEPPRLRSLRRGIPRDLEIVVERCLQKSPSDRLESCGELAAELERIESDRPIHCRRVSFVERAISWVRRNPGPTIAFAIILFTTVLGTWSWGLRLAESRRNENVVQQLQLQLEVKNIERRELLTDLMRKAPTQIRLLPQDIEFLESTMLTSTSTEQRLFCAKVLARNEVLAADRYDAEDPRREIVLEILGELLEQDIDEDLKSKVQSILQQLGPLIAE